MVSSDQVRCFCLRPLPAGVQGDVRHADGFGRVQQELTCVRLRAVHEIHAPLFSRQNLKKFISGESSPGHIDGNDVFYHWTIDAVVQGVFFRSWKSRGS